MADVMKKLLCCQLSLLIVWTNLVYAFQSTEDILPANTEMTASTQIELIFQQLDQLWLMLDRTQFDPDALLDSLNYEGEKIIQHVKKAIHFQAYLGALRGPEGTLISQSGNSLDQSLLLAKLLKDAGYEARIARGTLPQEFALQLLQGMRKEVSWPPMFQSPAQMEGWMQTFIPGAPKDSDQFKQEATEYSEQISSVAARNNETVDIINQSLAKTLPADFSTSAARSIEGRLVAELGDYFWVEHKLDHSGGWKAAHPAFSAPITFELEKREYFDNEIPATLQHRVRYQVFLERTLGNKKEIFPLMSAWEQPAANAAHKPHSLAIFPYSDFMQNGDLDLSSGLDKTKFYTVLLNNDLAPGAQVFTIDGLVGPPDALSPSGQFIATVAEKGLSAANAVSNLGSSGKSAESGLTRIWFEFTRTSPDGQSQTVTRDILTTLEDGRKLVQGRVAPENTWKSELKHALFQSWQIGVSTGPISPAFNLSQYVSHIQDSKPSIAKLLDFESQGSLTGSKEIMQEISPFPDLRPTRFFGLANGETGFSSDTTSFLATPMLVAFGRGIYTSNGQLFEYLQSDILFNERRSLVFDGDIVAANPMESSRKGIWDTIIEALPDTLRERGTDRSAYPTLEAQIEDLEYVGPSEASKLHDLGIAEPATSIATRELQAGYGLILSRDFSSENPAWWRVDLQTGTVTGMGVGPGGYGGVTATEAIIILFASVSFILRWVGYINCWENETGLNLFCCLVDSYITNQLMAAMAFAIAHLITMGVTALGANMGAAVVSAEMELVTAIIGAALTDIPGVLITFADFKLEVCGTLTGGDDPPPPPDPQPSCPPQLPCPIQ